LFLTPSPNRRQESRSLGGGSPTHLPGHPPPVHTAPRRRADGLLPTLPGDRRLLDEMLSCSVVGSPETLRRGLEAFVARTGADELMLTSQIYDHVGPPCAPARCRPGSRPPSRPDASARRPRDSAHDLILRRRTWRIRSRPSPTRTPHPARPWTGTDLEAAAPAPGRSRSPDSRAAQAAPRGA